MKAWHFSDGWERYGEKRELIVGVTHKVRGQVIPCKNGLHGCERAIDALFYAGGSIACLVELGGTIVPRDGDKHAASERTYLARVDATDILHEFGCWCAERGLKGAAQGRAGEPYPASWNAIKVKRAWLRGEATDAELTIAESAAWSAVNSVELATWSGARAAAQSGARAVQNRKLEAMLRKAMANG